MKGDFTRFGFDPTRHFSRVLMQQGRVTLDADANESVEVLLHHLRRLTRDLYGAYGGPPDSGFTLAAGSGAGGTRALLIGPGHYYVNGILCENEQWTDYANQPQYTPPGPDASGAGGDALLAWLRSPGATQSFWVYLDVWERHVGWVEDDSIREVALGGPDTCSRSQVVWQVKALPWNPKWGSVDAGAQACPLPLPSIPTLGSGRLAAELDSGPNIPDPCVIPPAARYRGAQNQLYRVEIHTGGDATTATFKWSRENGSVATRWLGNGSEAGDAGTASATTLVVQSSRGFAAGDWVEVTHDALEFAGQPGTLLLLAGVDGDQLILDGSSGSAPAWSAALGHPRVRRWDQKVNDQVALEGGAVPVTETAAGAGTPAWIPLEDGLQLAFAAGGQYVSGDYWVIPARVGAQDLGWPQDAAGAPAFEPPRGIVRAYAPLAIVSGNADGVQITPCRSCASLAPVVCTIAEPPGQATIGPRPLPPPRPGVPPTPGTPVRPIAPTPLTRRRGRG